MQVAAFNAFCPFEIGDKIEVNQIERTITDIACIHYLKSGKIEFSFQFDNQKSWHSLAPEKLMKEAKTLGGVPNLGTTEKGGNNGI